MKTLCMWREERKRIWLELRSQPLPSSPSCYLPVVNNHHPRPGLLQQLRHWAFSYPTREEIIVKHRKLKVTWFKGITLLSVQLPFKVDHVIPLLQTSHVTQGKTQRPCHWTLAASELFSYPSLSSPRPSSRTGSVAISALCSTIPTGIHVAYSLTSFRSLSATSSKKPFLSILYTIPSPASQNPLPS